MTLERFQYLIRQRLLYLETERGKTQYRVTREGGLPSYAIRTVLEGRMPGLERADAICRALGLEFRIGEGEGEQRTVAGEREVSLAELEAKIDLMLDAVGRIVELLDARPPKPPRKRRRKNS